MVNLKAKPFYLDAEAEKWVHDTIASMSDEEKVGQLFVNIFHDTNPEKLKALVTKYHIGAARYSNAGAEALYEQNLTLQNASKIPLLIASNCEGGGNGGVSGGTMLANGAAIAAADSEEMAYQVAYMGCKEAAAIGCNWNFAPVIDLLYNWRNTIVQIRSFNDSPEDTIRYAKAFQKGCADAGMATCMKHFPGDGTEENDQHIMLGVNDFSCEEWDKTFGKVYKELIDNGCMTIMAGHIAQPAYQRKMAGRDVPDSEILPATLCPELITGLLRGQLGFNGLVVTDATHMIGMFAAMPRKQQVPAAIAAGCDLFLFFNDHDEDFGYMLDGYKNGIITEERMNDALCRILGTKAAIGLHKKQAEGTLLPPKENLSVVGCAEHLAAADKFADQYITLVKDTQKVLPISVEKHKRIRLIFLEGEGRVIAGQLHPSNTYLARDSFKKMLEAKGFEVTITDPVTMSAKGKTEEFKKKYDLVLVVADVVGMAQYNVMRAKWLYPVDQPWYVAEVPTIFISLNFTNHLIDFTMSHTYINAYTDADPTLNQLVEKLMGNSAFKGRYNDNVWCGRWDTKI